MSFFTKLIADAQPKANTLKQAAAHVASSIRDSKAVQVSGAVAYNGLVNTVGIGLVLVQPVVLKAGELASTAWARVEELGSTKPEVKK